MILTKNKLFLSSLIVLSLVILGCSKDGGGSSPEQNIGPIVEGTTETLVYMPVDNFEIPVYLSIPEECQDGPLPAVVVMHGSDGMWTNHDPDSKVMSGQFKEWQAIFAQNCIVGVFVDSYSGRGVITRTGKWRELPDNFRISAQFVRPKDANAALSMLQNLKYNDGSPVVDKYKIALLGFSDGASAVASSLIDTDRVPESFKWTQSEDGKEYDSSDGVLPPQTKPEIGFSGGVFYYGGSVGYNYWGKHPCGTDALEGNIFYPYAPMLYNTPSDGYLSDNTLCLIDVLIKKGAPIELNLYDGVGHGFDFDNLPQSVTARNNTIKWLKELWIEN